MDIQLHPSFVERKTPSNEPAKISLFRDRKKSISRSTATVLHESPLSIETEVGINLGPRSIADISLAIRLGPLVVTTTYSPFGWWLVFTHWACPATQSSKTRRVTICFIGLSQGTGSRQ